MKTWILNYAIPWKNGWLMENVMYKSTAKTTKDTKQYVELSGLTFKSRYTRPKCSFNNYKHRYKTTLSK